MLLIALGWQHLPLLVEIVQRLLCTDPVLSLALSVGRIKTRGASSSLLQPRIWYRTRGHLLILQLAISIRCASDSSKFLEMITPRLFNSAHQMARFTLQG